MTRLKLHISPCPNDTFMFDGWLNGRIEGPYPEVEPSFYDIEELNMRVMRGEPDISKISCAILPEIEREYCLLESGAALGRGNGPLLVRRKGESSPLRRVAVPGLHTTACSLMRRLFPEVEELQPMLFSEIAEAVECGRFDAGVLIHEGRFVYKRHDLELVADLGVEWERQTGLALPLGAIVIRRSLGEELQLFVEKSLRQSIQFAFDHPQCSRSFVKAHAREMEEGVINSHIALFVNSYSLDLGEEGHRAIDALTRIG